MTLSHEFKAPLASILMLLENLLESIVKEKLREKILLVIAQINLLLCLVTDLLDIKMLKQGKYIARSEEFSPRDTFNFVLSIFT